MATPQRSLPDAPPAPAYELAPGQDQAVDAWIVARAGEPADPPSSPAERSAVERLGTLLNSAATCDRALVDVTMARVYRLRAAEARGEALLTDDDTEALDAWVLAEMDSASTPRSLRPRAERLEAIGALLTRGPGAAAGDTLVARTLARVQAHTDAQAGAMRLERHRLQRPRGLRLADVVSVAAVVALGSAVVMPVLSAVREQQRRTVCLANLGHTASAMSSYAMANRDALPMAVAGLGAAPWWDVDPQRSHSNSSNLYTLAREGYARLASLACPGNPYAPTSAPAASNAVDWRRLEEISYSYQVMFGPTPPRWNGPERTVVLTDRSPIILAAIRQEAVSPVANAHNHGGRGQHLLRNDGTVEWATSPVLASGDNIWLPRPVERQLEALRGRPMPLKGRETPEAADDVFVGP